MLELDERWIWDFWHVLDGRTHHLFFLSAPRSLGDPELRHWNVTIGHATSPDLRDWTVHEDVLGPGEAGAFDDRTTWTGSVVRDGDGWVMAYTGTSSVEDAKVQRIGIARSNDLFTWTRQPDGVFAADGVHYERLDPEVWFDEAWRDPWLFRHDGRWHCFLTARANEGSPRDRGVIGHAVSDDLRSWEVLPPVSPPMGLGQLEVPQLCNIGGHWQLVFCSDTDTQSDAARRDLPGTGTFHLVGDGPLGPFHGPPHAIEAGPDPTTYAGRVVEGTDGRHWFLAWERTDAAGAFIGRIGPPRELRADATGRLHLA